MKKNFVAAAAAFALIGAASAASATTFTGSYTASYYTGTDNGLTISIADQTPGSGTGFTFNLNSVGASKTVDLFKISTPESAVNSDDEASQPFTLAFNFTNPQGSSGSVGGTTQGESDPAYFLGFIYLGQNESGTLTWDNGGNATLNFGSYGNLLVHLDDATFDQGFDSLGNRSADVKATFTLEAPSAVPEPMSWALMLTGFMGLGAALRFSRRQGAALTAA